MRRREGRGVEREEKGRERCRGVEGKKGGIRTEEGFCEV